ncbi:hypothetical protein PS838_01452 [Pseudomonas fluorescens]|nr:hypothetical protein PS838_01452 [Pseudomonas fluorescens]
MKVLIRNAVASDFSQIRMVVEANDASLGASFTRDWDDWGARGFPFNEQFFVAIHANEILGITGFRPDAWGATDVWWLVWLYIHPLYKRKGIATKLFTVAQNELYKIGCRKAYLDVGDLILQADAVAFHQKSGFSLEGSLIDFWGAGAHHHIFGKKLGSNRKYFSANTYEK